MSVLLKTGMSAPPAASRADRFLARVDTALPAMTPAEQRKFLDQMTRAFESQYRTFIRGQGRKAEYSANPRDPVSAADFTLTLAGLAARRAAIAKDRDAELDRITSDGVEL